jgi:hypothetical protein
MARGLLAFPYLRGKGVEVGPLAGWAREVVFTHGSVAVSRELLIGTSASLAVVVLGSTDRL